MFHLSQFDRIINTRRHDLKVVHNHRLKCFRHHFPVVREVCHSVIVSLCYDSKCPCFAFHSRVFAHMQDIHRQLLYYPISRYWRVVGWAIWQRLLKYLCYLLYNDMLVVLYTYELSDHMVLCYKPLLHSWNQSYLVWHQFPQCPHLGNWQVPFVCYDMVHGYTHNHLGCRELYGYVHPDSNQLK